MIITNSPLLPIRVIWSVAHRAHRVRHIHFIFIRCWFHIGHSAFKLADGIGELQHKILLQHLRYTVFNVGLRYGAAYAFVLV